MDSPPNPTVAALSERLQKALRGAPTPPVSQSQRATSRGAGPSNSRSGRIDAEFSQWAITRNHHLADPAAGSDAASNTGDISDAGTNDSGGPEPTVTCEFCQQDVAASSIESVTAEVCDTCWRADAHLARRHIPREDAEHLASIIPAPNADIDHIVAFLSGSDQAKQIYGLRQQITLLHGQRDAARAELRAARSELAKLANLKERYRQATQDVTELRAKVSDMTQGALSLRGVLAAATEQADRIASISRI